MRIVWIELGVFLVLGAVGLPGLGQVVPNTSENPSPTVVDRWATLPTERTFGELITEARTAASPDFDPLGERDEAAGGAKSLDIANLLRPRVELQLEWEPAVEGLAIWGADVSVQVPTYPIFGPPPPLITWGYSFTEIASPSEWQLPEVLHDLSLGLAWVRRLNDQWMARFTLGAAFASDWENTSSEAWQLRGGAFALYSPNDRWNWAVGVLATGRDDLPVIPAIGAIWKPDPNWNVNLMFPTPRISRLIFDNGTRQHWAYFGTGFTGGTWAYDRLDVGGERLTYREWRLLAGWESTPPLQPGEFRPTGTKFNLELGYVFGREFEFDDRRPAIHPGDGWLLRTGVSF